MTYGNKTMGFICEINQMDADRIISERRDYNYGSPVYDIKDVEYGPAFTIFPEDIVMIPNAVLVYIDCSAVGNPKPTYRWIKVEGDREIELTYGADQRYTLTNGKLTIQTPKPSDIGQYRCEAMNKFGKIRTKTIQMSFGSLGEFSNVRDAPYNTLAYDGAAVECSRISYNPAVAYSWKRTLDNNVVQSIYTEVTPHIFASLNGKLYFSEIQKVDAGEYYCQVDLFGLSRNAVGAAQPPSRTSYPIEVSVQDQAAKPNWGPSIQNDFIAVFPKPPLRGQDVQMECFAYGSARNYETSWLYSWRREGAPLPKSVKMLDFNRILIIPNAQKHDEGTYTCFVSRNSQQTDSRSVTIVLSAKPYFVIPLKTQHLDSGSTINWRCQASGTPAPRYTWFKNGEMLTPQPDLQINRNILTISNADAKRHSGMYQCRASNDLGEAYSTAEVRVLSFKPTFRKNPLPNGLDAALRGNVTIVCDPEAAPAPEKFWYRNNVKLNLQVGTMMTGPRVRKLPSGNIYITSIQQSDAGIYTCEASNTNGKASSSCRINVRDSAVITVKPKATQTVFVNETAFIACEASYNPALDLLYIWKFNGQAIDVDKDYQYARSPHASGIMIKMAQFWNAGTYECIARTTLNEVSAKGILKIEGPPGEPVGVYGDAASVTSTSIHLFWFPGADHGQAITHYRIEAESDFEHGKWITVAQNIPEIQTKLSADNRDKRHFFVTSLDPGNGYRFRVQAINQLGFGLYSQPSRYYQTLQAPPSEAPSGLSGGGGSVGDLTITWKKLHRRYHGGDGLNYTVYWRLYSGDASGKWEYKAGINWETEKFVEMVGENNFYLEYEVKIQAWNRLGPGVNSSTVLVYSAEGMPIAAPLDVSSSGFNSTALEVTWTEVEDTREKMKGKIGGYQVNYWLRYEEEPVYKRFIRFKGQRSSGIIIGLASDSYYYTEVLLVKNIQEKRSVLLPSCTHKKYMSFHMDTTVSNCFGEE
ncbi:hypothetical protein KUTeg_015436 [Tegillarca granosa]|uniref:Contactin n=1 Tax=Tegillarca granosa TaxID=220873 RepID=A0ABQ9ETR2_TEGGR|nr:hypothetical protein KUTeg_015436 [Tegillarca granosa]